jgi:hypothetical protein
VARVSTLVRDSTFNVALLSVVGGGLFLPHGVKNGKGYGTLESLNVFVVKGWEAAVRVIGNLPNDERDGALLLDDFVARGWDFGRARGGGRIASGVFNGRRVTSS